MRIDMENGRIVSDTGHTMVFIDSRTKLAEVFQYDVASGLLSDEDRDLWVLVSGKDREPG